MTLQYDYTFMIDEINKFLNFSSMRELMDKKADFNILEDLVNNYIANMRKLEEKDIETLDRDQKLHFMTCSFKIQLMSKFNDIMGEAAECFK